MKTIVIGVMPQEKIRARAIAIAKGEYKPKPCEPKIWFTSMKSVAEVLSDENRALLKVIRETNPDSIGCGAGASTLVLARELDAQIIAVDSLCEFLEVLRSRAAQAGLSDRIGTVNASMDTLPFEAGSLDAIWSEGAIYNMGFESGVRQWRRFLKRGGILAISELTWLTASRPAELEAHWCTQYTEVGTASSKLAVLERNGYAPMAYFVLPEHCWLDAYYGPMQQRLPAFLARHESSDAAKAVAAAEELEIALYERYRAFVGYGYYVARKTEGAP